MQELFTKITEKNLENKLYIVPTPIGNLMDITIRALNVLTNCDIIFCEDTRMTKKMLNLYGISDKILYTYNNYSDDNQRNNIINLIKNENKSIALVSDAGTPLVSDPGYKLVEKCKQNNIDVVPLPGASASITALSSCGLATDKFLFYGFLQPKYKDKEKEIEKILTFSQTTICYETAIRLLDTLTIINNFNPNKKICVARELTKTFEDIKTDSVSNILEYYTTNKDKLKGEIVLIFDKYIEEKKENSIDENLVKTTLKYMSKKDCSNYLSEILNINKKEIYDFILKKF
jgi:16S rRNA (cytidine1402-2'-O)-methyltransferase